MTLVPGDGIGPEVVGCAERVIAAVRAPIEWERFDGISGSVSGAEGAAPNEEVPTELEASIRRNGVCLKGTLFSPLSEANTSTQSLNIQLRKDLDLYVNLVHAFSIPGLKTRHDGVDITIVRESTEGEYSGLEHEVVPGVVESLKVITEAKSRRIAEYAFEYAALNDRRKVTAVHKANIMKLGDGQFLAACREVSKQYPTIEFEEMIVDNTCMQLVSRPEQFDVMVTPNLYGTLVCNIAAGLTGGPGVVPGSYVGERGAIFEQGARSVSKDLAGKGIANPTAMLLTSAMLLRHLQMPNFADRIEKAVMATVAAGDVLTPDVGGSATSEQFTDKVIAMLG